MLDYIDAKTLKKMFLAGAKNLQSNKEWINELNVFPVPDGDTGTNMTLTLMSAVKELTAVADDADLEVICKKIANGTLRGARGNSGVIMSQLCRGFSKEVESADNIDSMLIASAFDRAVNTAFKAVMKPKKGTILTVAKAAANKAAELSMNDMPLSDYFEEILQHAEYILTKTPEMLPVLKEAGVVDAGGQGLVVFLRGALDAYLGKEVDLTFEAAAPAEHVERTGGVDTSNISTADIKFGYCTEFIINADHEITLEEEKDIKDYLSSIGDSLVVVAMDEIVKVHVHTNHPGDAFEKGLTYGSLTNMKVDNMRVEHNEKLIKESDRSLAAEQALAMEESAKARVASPVKPRQEFGFVAVCAGKGLADVYKGMNVDEVIEGGQTMNPSTEDVLAALDAVDADQVFVFPNNGNIIMAANQACELCEGKKAVVIPTKTVAQGITALFNFAPAKTFEENQANMTEAIGTVKTAEITYAVRDTEIDGKAIHKDDFMGLGDGHILAVGKELQETTIETVKAMLDEDSELITIYYGDDASQEDAERIREVIEPEHEDIDIDVIYGGQPVYYYIISVE